MNIVHIATTILGGAGIGLRRLHESLLHEGLESRVLCHVRARGDDPEQFIVRRIRTEDWRKNNLPALLLRLHLWESAWHRGVEASKEIRARYKQLFSPARTLYRLDREPCVLAADLVHLHWIGSFLDVPSFFRHCRKPIVWTMRDEYPLLGGFHYRSLVPPNLTPRLAAVDREQFRLKRRAIASHPNVSFIALSEEMAAMARASEMCRGCRVFVIPNPVSEAAVRIPPVPRAEARAALGLPQDAAVVLFVAQFLHDVRKGLASLAEAVTRLRAGGRRVVLAAVGRPTHRFALPEGTLLPGFLSAPEDILPWYHAADVFVNPSLSEGCCKTLLDAGACGVPAVAFPHAGAREAIGEAGGVVTADFTVDALVDGIRRVLDSRWDRAAIRERSLRLFSPDAIARRHEELYRTVLKGPAPQ